MVPVSNSGSLSSRTLTGNGRNGGLGQATVSPFVAASEPLTYAHIGATGLYADRGANESPMAPEKTDPYGQAVRQNRFQEIFERQAASLASQAATAPANSPDFAATAGWGAHSQSNGKAPVTARKEMKWAISMVGNQVQLSVNPNAG